MTKVHAIAHLSEVAFSFEIGPQKKQWQTSRYALAKAMKKLYPQRPLTSLSDLEINHHHTLKKDPGILVGLSHTKDFGAAVLGPTSKIKGLGIDIELSSRTLKQGVQKFFLHKEDDLFLQKNPLLLWMAKEASYKALAPLYKKEKTLVLKDFWIRDRCFGLGSLENGPLGTLQFFLDTSPVWIVIALLKNIGVSTGEGQSPRPQ